jgi:NCS1 family nucleobase:cation symporter-1
MRFVPEQGSRMDHQVTGEDIVVANDERKHSISKV